MKSIGYLLTLAALTLAGAATATASQRNVDGVVVRYGDLDLNSQTGVARLHKRIRNAAESVCSPLETRILGLRDGYDNCVTEAVRNGVAAVANANLSNFHANKGKRVVVASN